MRPFLWSLQGSFPNNNLNCRCVTYEKVNANAYLYPHRHAFKEPTDTTDADFECNKCTWLCRG
jgi:hypothetical protein